MYTLKGNDKTLIISTHIWKHESISYIKIMKFVLQDIYRPINLMYEVASPQTRSTDIYINIR